MMGVFVQLNEGVKNSMAIARPVGYVIEENGCWGWVGGIDSEGYGWWGKRRAHRRVYETHRGAVPRGLVLDHTCRNRACVNPDHLEPVTNRENILRGVGVTAQQARRTHCPQGHQLGPFNGRQRECPECVAARHQRDSRNGVYRDRYKKRRGKAFPLPGEPR